MTPSPKQKVRKVKAWYISDSGGEDWFWNGEMFFRKEYAIEALEKLKRGRKYGKIVATCEIKSCSLSYLQ